MLRCKPVILIQTNFVFGSDILGQGCVLKQTFTSPTSPSFSFDDKTNTLTITAKNIYQTLGDLRNTTEEPYILIRRDSSRTAGLDGDKKFSGLRVLGPLKFDNSTRPEFQVV